MKLYRNDSDYPALYELILKMVRDTLREDWDPLGVANEFPTAYDEYDNYAPGLATMLMHGVSSEVWMGERARILAYMELTEPEEETASARIFDLLRQRAIKIANEFYD